MREDEMNYTDREILMDADLDFENIPERSLKAILEALKQGRKIEAIKLYREVTGAGLAEAKRAVESIKLDADPYHENSDPVTIKMGGRNNLLFWAVGLAALLLIVFSMF